MGCSCAYQLARRGLSVAVVDKQLVGEGPTGQSSAILRTHYSNELTARMAKFGLEFYRDFEQHIGDECGFHRTGFLVLLSEGDRTSVAANLEIQHRIGIRGEMLDLVSASELVPGAVSDGLAGALWEPDSGYADPYLAVTGLARAGRSIGVQILQETEVTDVRLDHDRVRGVETATGALEAPIVVNTAGAWGARIGRMAGVELPISACRVQVGFFRRPEGLLAGHPVIADFVGAFYLRPDVGDLTLAGLIDPKESEAIVDPDHFARSADFGFQATLASRLLQRLPAMAQSGCEKGFASLYAITPDWHPLIGELIPGSGFYVCSGFSGHGFKLAPAVGVMMADLITDSETAFDPALFHWNRYADQQSVQGRYDFSIVG